MKDINARSGGRTFVLVFIAAALVRLILFFTVYGDMYHGSAHTYGSAALGIYHGEGITQSTAEVEALEELGGNRAGDFHAIHQSTDRSPMTEFLPGPSFVLALLWRITSVANYAPYLVAQIVIDALLIACFALVFTGVSRIAGIVTAALMVVNLASIKRTLMMGYDFWPQYSVLVFFVGLYWIMASGRGKYWYLVLGLLLAPVVWFREITSLLPLFMAPVILFILVRLRRLTFRPALARVALLVVPMVLSLASLAMYRYETTGNYRPTRSTFWHSFFAGVAQFENPYGIEHDDNSIWEFGRRLNPDLRRYTLGEMYESPDSPYETTLRKEAKVFVREHPLKFIRNTLYRVGIMISPFLYPYGDFIPRSVRPISAVIGALLLPFWFLGMYRIGRTDRQLFWLALGVYGYFFAMFSWFYVVGRVIVPYMFISIFVFTSGLGVVLERLSARVGPGKRS